MSNSHLIVVGSGIAGLYSALLAAEAGTLVTIVSKGSLEHSNTQLAQGGICAVLGAGEATPGDSVEAHIADTLSAGAGQCNQQAVRILCAEAAGDIATLERFGVAFDRDPVTGHRALGLEGAHSAARILHAGGDATGAAVAVGLIRAVQSAAALGTIRIMERAFVKDLMVDNGHVAGISILTRDGGSHALQGDAVVLASGGAGQLFEFTTNPSVATADGLAAAWRAGAEAADLEYFQFHPTALAVGGNFLISEAVRGAGAVLRDRHGEGFMNRYHPEGDLAPRDVVSRSIASHLRSIKAAPGETVFLDATGVEAENGAGFLARRFPTIDATTRELGFDWTRDWLPVTPAAHYWMGGVATDLQSRTSLPGLFAAGEVACTGVHGANRLASNSLLEGLVFGRRAVQAFLAAAAVAADGPLDWPTGPHAAAVTTGPAEGTSPVRTSQGGRSRHGASQDGSRSRVAAKGPPSREALRRLMSSHAGVVRDADGLRQAAEQIATWRAQPPTVETAAAPTTAAQAAAELENLLLAAELLVHAALTRDNSIGAHQRSDFPEPPASGWTADRHPRATHLRTTARQAPARQSPARQAQARQASAVRATGTYGTAVDTITKRPTRLPTSQPVLESENA